MLASFIGINATVNNISAMMYNMAFNFIGVQRDFQHCDKLTNLHVYSGIFFCSLYLFLFNIYASPNKFQEYELRMKFSLFS